VLSLIIAHREKSPEGPTPPFSHVSDYAPFYEVDAHWEPGDDGRNVRSIRDAHARLGRRVFNTHIRHDMLPPPPPAGGLYKVIYVVRSGPDVCWSFYNHLSNQVEGKYTGSFQDFVGEMCAGTLPYGKWTDHVLSFLGALSSDDDRRRAEPPTEMLLLSYEGMVGDISSSVRRIVRFLDLDVDDDQVEALLPKFTFRGMVKDLDKFQPRSVGWTGGFRFLRKGVVGDGEEHMRNLIWTENGDGDDGQHNEAVTVLDKFVQWSKSELFLERLEEILLRCNSEVRDDVENTLAWMC